MSDRRVAMKLKHERIADTIEDAVMARIQGGKVMLGDGTVLEVDALDWNGLNPNQMRQLLELAHKIKLTAHGEATDYLKGAFMLSVADVGRIIDSIIEVVHRFWGDDPRWSLFIQQVQSIPNR
jgi:hypothetical protein